MVIIISDISVKVISKFYQNLNDFAIKKGNCYWILRKLSDKLTAVTVFFPALKNVLYLRQPVIPGITIGINCLDEDVFLKLRGVQVERDWHSTSEEGVGVTKQCKLNIYINITRKRGSSPSDPLKVPSAKFFLRYSQQSIDFHKCWAWGVTCSHCTSIPCPFASHSSFLVPSQSLRWDPVWLSSPAPLHSALDAAAWAHPWARYIRYFLYVFAQKAVFILLDPLCWVGIISVLWGKTHSGLSVLPSVHKYRRSKENAHTCLWTNTHQFMFLSLSCNFYSIAVKNFSAWLFLKGYQLAQWSFGNSGGSETCDSQMLRLGW